MNKSGVMTTSIEYSHCISQIRTSVYSRLYQSSYSWFILSNYNIFCLILIDCKEISNSRVDRNFGWFTITYIILAKYLLWVCWLSKTDSLFVKINIYFHPKMIKTIIQIYHLESISKILYDVVNLGVNVSIK